MQSRVLSATAVMVCTMGRWGPMQRVDNRIWRQILGQPRNKPVAALQGEIGASTVKGRDMK